MYSFTSIAMYSMLMVNVGLPSAYVVPLDQIVEVTYTTNFTAKAKGIGSKQFTYQWNHNGTLLRNENNPTLLIHDIKETNAGSYSCIVSNTYGDSNTSNTVALYITSRYI